MDNGSQAARETRIVELVVPGIGLVDRTEALEPPAVRRISGDESAGWYGTVAEARARAGAGAGTDDDGSEPPVERQVYDTGHSAAGSSRSSSGPPQASPRNPCGPCGSERVNSPERVPDGGLRPGSGW
ncbi:hypothetical protein [Streptomyces sp. NBC_00878]|uniref:hypothetical protein n=1 Tax=Streptomyces sp. NBC_00878 TaxID=2975854 RepID=UPI00225823F7|nr:hypothetical protein [Streptomyces sp. NBC_00878]MCX4905713.1 hypothetical protein [Streptomyces sp. NBC_00878]